MKRFCVLLGIGFIAYADIAVLDLVSLSTMMIEKIQETDTKSDNDVIFFAVVKILSAEDKNIFDKTTIGHKMSTDYRWFLNVALRRRVKNVVQEEIFKECPHVKQMDEVLSAIKRTDLKYMTKDNADFYVWNPLFRDPLLYLALDKAVDPQNEQWRNIAEQAVQHLVAVRNKYIDLKKTGWFSQVEYSDGFQKNSLLIKALNKRFDLGLKEADIYNFDWMPLLMKEAMSSVEAKLLPLAVVAGIDIKNMKDEKGNTLLNAAARVDANINTIKFLLDIGADKNAQNNEGYTPLMSSMTLGSPELTNLLLEAGADPNIKNNAGETPLWRAVFVEKIDLVENLIKHGALLAERNKRGETLLMAAAQKSNPIFVQLVLKGSEVNAVDNQGQTALMEAAYSGKSPSIVKILLEAGADVNVRDKSGHTALWYTKIGKNTEIIDLLKKAGAVE